MEKYHGEFTELQSILLELNYSGLWSDEGAKKVFRCDDGAVLNWWPSTGTIQFQGPLNVSNKLEKAVSTLVGLADIVSAVSSSSIANPSPNDVSLTIDSTLPPTSIDSKRVFVVYGHDITARDQLELILRRLKLEPFVLANTSGEGLTIIEALENEMLSPPTGNRFGVVLLTPDDMGYEQGRSPQDAEPRARQNVILEMGMLIAAFGKERVAILRKGEVAVPSDASGILYLPFDGHVKETAGKLCERLLLAGFNLDSESVARVSA